MKCSSYIFQLWFIIKALLKQISLYLLSHFRIRIILLTCPDNKSVRKHQPKSCVPAKLSTETSFEMERQHGRIRRFTVGPVYPNKSLTVCSSDFIFRKYKQDSAFRVSGVLQLAKTGPPVKNFPLLRLFPSDAMICWRLYTPYDVNPTNLHILTALKFENYESVQHRPQFSGIKKGAKISFHRHFNN